MKNFLRSAKIFWYVLGSCAFLFGCMVSLSVLLGLAGTDNGAPLAGLFSLIVFWYAASTYRKKGTVLMDEAYKEGKKLRGEDDVDSDDQI